MHFKSDSGVTSSLPSSPRSPKRPLYYVQSLPRDSHDGDKLSWMQATPAYNSPMESPSRPSYCRHHSRASSVEEILSTKKEPPYCDCFSPRTKGSFIWGWGKFSAVSADNVGGVPVTLVFEVRSRGNVVGMLVKSRHRRHISCSLAVDSHSSKPVKLKESSCTYN